MKPSPAIVPCGSDAARPGLTGSLRHFHGADSRWPTALAALLLAWVLLPAGFASVSHEHDGGHSGAEHHCEICCLQDLFPGISTAAASLTPDLATSRAAPWRRSSGCDAALVTQATRGPPA